MTTKSSDPAPGSASAGPGGVPYSDSCYDCGASICPHIAAALSRLAAAERRAEEAEKSRDVAVAQVAGRPTWDDLQFATDQVNAAELKAEGEREFRRRAESSLASERAARERAERERESQRSDAVKFHGMLLAAESRLSRAVEALREIAGEGLPIGSLPVCHRCKALRDAARAVLAEVGK